MRAFIIRPFGTKKGIDFNRVERELIDPALNAHKIGGRTTADSLKQGNIRVEMFHRLLTADIVIVDVSIHNANVYYELGIRHALRKKRTFMIRSESSDLPPDEVPFDLKTDRYLSYKVEDPGAALPTLIEGLRQTLLSEEKDSPVFQLLPDLEEQETTRFLAAPRTFQEEVERAKAQEKPYHRRGDLKLLETEVRGFSWEQGGLRVVGRAQVKKKIYEDARDTWESIREENPDDIEANTWLGTIYQRLGNLTESNLALDRVLRNPQATSQERAEAYSLIGRNYKVQWKAEWDSAAPDERRAQALRSPFLMQSYDKYKQAFAEDLNHFYPGLNAAGLLTVTVELAAALPEVWEERFEETEEAERQLKRLKDELSKLCGSVTMSLEAAKARMDRSGNIDTWLVISLADMSCLTSKRSSVVADQYRKALVNASDFDIDAVRAQLLIYDQLTVVSQNVTAALAAIRATAEAKENPPYVLLFTGHRIDSPKREKPRFPANKEDAARQAIKERVAEELDRVGPNIVGIAGGASGGDTLFHEVCAELGIPTTLYLVMPRNDYIRESVQDAGSQWVVRFNKLYEHLPKRQLCNTDELPRWLQDKKDYTIWQRSNLWMFYNSIAQSDNHFTLIALWDGGAGDGPGGTEDMVKRAEDYGAQTQIIPTKETFGL